MSVLQMLDGAEHADGEVEDRGDKFECAFDDEAEEAEGQEDEPDEREENERGDGERPAEEGEEAEEQAIEHR